MLIDWCRECGLPSAAQQAATEAERDRTSLLGRSSGAPPPLTGQNAGMAGTMAAAGAARDQLRQNLDDLADVAEKTDEVRCRESLLRHCPLYCKMHPGAGEVI